MKNYSLKFKIILNLVLFLQFSLYLLVLPSIAAAVRAQPGDIPERVPLYETPYGVGPNYKGNINYSSDGQSQAEDGSLNNEAEGVSQDGSSLAGTAESQKTVHILSFWWLVLFALLAAGLVSYFYVKGRRKKG